MIPTRDSNHAPSAIRADVLSQLDQKGHSVLGSFQILTPFPSAHEHPSDARARHQGLYCCISPLSPCYVRRWIGHESYAASWYDDRTEKKMIPTRDSNHAPSAIRADVLSQLDQKGHSVLGSFQILTLTLF